MGTNWGLRQRFVYQIYTTFLFLYDNIPALNVSTGTSIVITSGDTVALAYCTIYTNFVVPFTMAFFTCGGQSPYNNTATVVI